MVKIIEKYKEIDFDLLFEVYKNVPKKRIEEYYPKCNYEEGLKEYKLEYKDFIKDFLKNPNNFLAINIKNNIYVSAFRLISLNRKKTEFYLEALETHSSYLRKGYAKELIEESIKILNKNKNIKIESSIKKLNVASLETHKKCGFLIDKDYVIFDDGVVRKDCYTMIYKVD